MSGLLPSWFSPSWFTDTITTTLQRLLSPISLTVGRIIQLLDGIRSDYLNKLLEFWQIYSGQKNPVNWDGIPQYLKSKDFESNPMATERIEKLCKDILARLQGGRDSEGKEIREQDSLYSKLDQVIQNINSLPDLSKLASKEDLSTSEKNIIDALQKAETGCSCKEIKEIISQEMSTISDEIKKKISEEIKTIPSGSGGQTVKPINYLPPFTTVRDVRDVQEWQARNIDIYAQIPKPLPKPKE